MKKILPYLICLALIFIPIIKEKTIYLTFDDGPLVPYTKKIAEELEKNFGRGTFFFVGRKAIAHSNIVRDLAQKGNTIGNHTYHHNRFAQENLKEALEDLIKGEIILADILGYFPALFRPPGGNISEEKLKIFRKLGFKAIFWDINTGDYEGTSKIRIIAKILFLGWDRSIILMHSCPSALKVLPTLIKILKALNFKIEPLPKEILKARIPNIERVKIGKEQEYLLKLIGEGEFIKNGFFFLKEAVSSLENYSKFRTALSRLRTLERKANSPEEKKFWSKKEERLQIYIRYSILRRKLIKIMIGNILSLPKSTY